MQVRAYYEVDGFGRIPNLREPFEGRNVELVDCLRRALLIVAKAGIDHDPQALRFNEIRVNRGPQLAVGVGVTGVKPGDRFDTFFGQAGKHEIRRYTADFELDNSRDLYLADLPLVCRLCHKNSLRSRPRRCGDELTTLKMAVSRQLMQLLLPPRNDNLHCARAQKMGSAIFPNIFRAM